MFGKKRIWQKPPVSVERPQASPGTPGQALQGSVQVAFNQQLQQEMADRKLGEDQLKILLDRLEQRIKGQSVELIEIKDHLERLRNELTEKIAQITAANAQLQRQAAEQDHYLNQKLAGLTRMVQQLQDRVGGLDQKEIELLEDIIDAKQPSEETAGLNPQELRALSELAKRLAQ
jgi:chromosome segregation ATPase